MINDLLTSAEEKVKNGANFWKSFLIKAEWKKDDFIIVLGDNQKVNKSVLGYLESVKLHYQIDRIFLFIYEVNQFSHVYVDREELYMYTLTEKEYMGLVTLYRLYKFSDRIIFVDSKAVSEMDTLKLLDTGKVTLDEVVKISILGLIGETQKAQISLHTEVKRLIADKKIDCKEQLMIFGENHNTKRLIDFYLRDYKIAAVLDNDVRKENRIICGVPIKYPSKEVLNRKKKIIIAASHYLEMLEQMEQYGYREGIDVFVVSKAENAPDEELMELDWRQENLRKGAEAYTNFIAHYPNTWLFYNQRATGNTYLLGMYIFDYVKKNRIDNFIVWNKKESSQELCSLMGIPSKLEDRCIDFLCDFADVVGWKKMKFKVMDPYNTRTNLIKMRGYKNIDFRTIYQYVLFEYGGDVSIPKLIQKDTDDIFMNTGLRKGHTVLISPYAYTISTIKKEIWTELICEIKHAGFDVCINCNQEEWWEGEKCVFLQYSEVIDFLDKAGYFLGVRSGLCDIVTQSKCCMAVLYPMEQSNALFSYFSIEAMGLKKESIIEVCDVERTECKDEIVSFFKTRRTEKHN